MAGALNQNLTCEGNDYTPTGGDIFRCFIICVVMILIIIGNVCCLVVFNSTRSKKNFTTRVRYMMNSLCCTDLSIGLLMCPSTVYSAVWHCWPFGEFICKVEALLISALFHESTLNMVLIAIDRYCIVHFQRYNTFMTSRRFLFVILGSWVSVFTCYTIVIFVGEQFYFDEIGVNCEPFYINPDVTLSVLSIFYFLPALIFLFCYGSIYRTASKRIVKTVSPDDKHGRMVNANIRTSKYLAAITCGFFIAVSPWTLCTLIIVAARVSIPEEADFFVTWLALSNSFWNCLIYGLMNRKFRKAALRFACGRWIKSLQETTSHRSQSVDSMEGSADNSAYLAYKRRHKSKRQAPYMSGEISKSVDSSNPAGSSAANSNTATPALQHRQVTDLIMETKKL
ncbi:neuromedin U receptor [Mactra antiquata]